MSKIKWDKVKQIVSRDFDGRNNGIIIELQKDGKKTLALLNVILPKCFIGYYLHKVSETNYICLQGEVEILMWVIENDINPIKVKYILKQGDKLHIGSKIPIAINNKSETDQSWILNFPDPAYDCDNEQVKYTEEECRDGKFISLLKEDGVI